MNHSSGDGKYYFVKSSTNEKCWILLNTERHTNYNLVGPTIGIYTKVFYPGGPWGSDHFVSKIRLATQEEIDWLDACIAANEFVPKPEIKGVYYEIY